jgi:lambda family phage portal protein
MGLIDYFKNRGNRGTSGKSVSRVYRKALGRAFSAANTGRLFSDWSASPESPDEIIRTDLSKLRARSRDQFINNPIIRRYVAMVRDNVAGPNGVVMQARILNGAGKADYPASEALERYWGQWSSASNCDYFGKHSFKELQWQALNSAAIDGEILAVVYTGRSYGDHFFQVQHIDPELLDSSYNNDLSGGRKIRMGIEYDVSGRVTHYHLLSVSARPGSYAARNGKRYIRISATRVIHAYRSDQVGQSRGYPWAAPVLDTMKHLDAYVEAAITAARAGASKMGFISSEEGEYVGDDVDENGDVIAEFEAGVIERLENGETFQAFDPRYPHEQFGEFIKTAHQVAASGLGVSYSGLSGNLDGVSYSSIRSGVLDERESWKVLQEWFIESYVRPIYEMWLSVVYDMGIVKVLGKNLVRPEAEYRNVSFQARRWSWVDPQKDANAKIQEIDNNITTLSAVIREQGKDPEDVFQERAKEKARLKELGLAKQEVI